ncbi:MAG: hypothetical protein J6S85_06680 [Methanobrevibacter sp.]|nr:hypothetical protein [Methanobrevibacter sp.]
MDKGPLCPMIIGDPLLDLLTRFMTREDADDTVHHTLVETYSWWAYPPEECPLDQMRGSVEFSIRKLVDKYLGTHPLFSRVSTDIHYLPAKFESAFKGMIERRRIPLVMLANEIREGVLKGKETIKDRIFHDGHSEDRISEAYSSFISGYRPVRGTESDEEVNSLLEELSFILDYHRGVFHEAFKKGTLSEMELEENKKKFNEILAEWEYVYLPFRSSWGGKFISYKELGERERQYNWTLDQIEMKCREEYNEKNRCVNE